MLGQVAERLRTAGGGGAARPPARARVGGRRRRPARPAAAPPRSPPWRRARHRRCASTCRCRAPAWSAPTGWRGPSATTTGCCCVATASADGPDAAWRDFCLRQADAVVLVAAAATPRRRGAGHPAPARRPDLVLLGPAPDARAAGGLGGRHRRLAAHPRRPATSAGGLRPLADRLAGRSLGLVLAGGGARAFAHVGVLRELEDAGLHVDRVAGTSIGAIVAGLHATGIDGARPGGGLLRRVRAAPAVQRLAALRPGRWPGGGGCTPRWSARSAPTRCSRGCPASCRMVSTDLVSRTRQVHRRGTPGRRGAGLGPAARAVRADRPTTTGGCSSTAGCSTTCRSTCSPSATRARSSR